MVQGKEGKKQTMSKDIIYREDAIEALDNAWINGTSLLDANEAVKQLNDLPSADRPQEDTVSRRYLLAEIDDLADEFSEVDENGLHGERWCGILDSKGIIVNAPSVSDRPQGYYIKGENGEWYCSICKRIDDKYSVARFCWHCGARMKGANDENV